jgi:hypothetical protein
MMTQPQRPDRAELGPWGEWVRPDGFGYTSDDSSWVQFGWCVRSYNGEYLFKTRNKTELGRLQCKEWLKENGYKPTNENDIYRLG